MTLVRGLVSAWRMHNVGPCCACHQVLDESRRRFAKIVVDPSDVATLPSEYKVMHGQLNPCEGADG
jgi:cytidine deaminase